MPPVVFAGQAAIGGAVAWYGTLGMVGQAVVQLAAGTALTAAQSQEGA